MGNWKIHIGQNNVLTPNPNCMADIMNNVNAFLIGSAEAHRVKNHPWGVADSIVDMKP